MWYEIDENNQIIMKDDNGKIVSQVEEQGEETKKARESIDLANELFRNIPSIKSKQELRNALDFCVRMTELSPYNAWLVRFQMPGAKYVLSKAKWKEKFGRAIKPDAHPLIILVPFGPVAPRYDVSDTYVVEGWQDAYTEDLNRRLERFNTEDEDFFRPRHGSFTIEEFDEIVKKIELYGINVRTLRAGNLYAGHIRPYETGDVDFPVSLADGIRTKSYFRMEVNDAFDPTKSLTTIGSLLGYLFLERLPCPKEWEKQGERGKMAWKERAWTSETTSQFEMEVAAYIAFRRIGVELNSCPYLASWSLGKGDVPRDMSIAHVLKTADKIESVLIDEIDFKISARKTLIEKGFLYKYDNAFRAAIDKMFKKNKNKESKKKKSNTVADNKEAPKGPTQDSLFD